MTQTIPEPKCPKCGFRAIRLSRRSTYLQTTLLPALGYYPWECAECRTVFMAKHRGARRRREMESTVPPPPADADSAA